MTFLCMSPRKGQCEATIGRSLCCGYGAQQRLTSQGSTEALASSVVCLSDLAV